MPDLGIAWVIRREMEVRSRRPSWYEGFAYEGLTAPTLCLALPLGVMLFRGRVTPEACTWLMIPYVLYLFFAAAGMASGGLAMDRECLSRLPVSAWTLLVGKLVGSLLNLWLEIAVISPFVIFLSLKATRSPLHGLVILGFLGWLILYGGLLGMTWARNDIAPRDVARQARSDMSLLIVGLPAAVLLIAVSNDSFGIHDLAGIWLLHPVGGVLLLGTAALDGRILVGIVMCALTAALLTMQILRRMSASLP